MPVHRCEICGRFFSSPLPDSSACDDHVYDYNRRIELKRKSPAAREAGCADADLLHPDGETREQLQAQLTEACKERDEAKAQRDMWKEAYEGTDHAQEQAEWQNERDHMVASDDALKAERDSLLQQIERLQQEHERLMRELGTTGDSVDSRTAAENRE